MLVIACPEIARRLRRDLVATSCAALAATSVLCWPLTATAQAVTTTATEARNYDVPAGPLGAALTALASQAGIALAFTPAQVEGRQSRGVQGKLPLGDALVAALTGSGLEAVRADDGGYVLRSAPVAIGAAILPAVKVEAAAVADGSAEQGYRSATVSQVGPWQGRTLQDTPYSINVVSAELIENVQAVSTDQIFKMNPVVQMSWPQMQNDSPYVNLRGFQSSTFLRNGVARQRFNFAHGTTTEDIERVEVLTGLSGFLYGAGYVGGAVNFVSKRPTEERLNSLTAGYAGGSNFYTRGDFGGPIDAGGRFGYRVNAVIQDGETLVEHQDLQRHLVSAALGWQIADDLRLDVNASTGESRVDGTQSYWYIGEGATRPGAERLDATKLWSQKWTLRDMESQRLGAELTWAAADWLQLRGAYLNEYNSRAYTDAENTIEADGTYTQSASTSKGKPQKINGEGGYAFADIPFSTGAIRHRFTVGVQFSSSVWDIYPNGFSDYVTVSGLSLAAPNYFDEPEWGPYGTGPRYQTTRQWTRSLIAGDDVTINDQWSVLVGVTRATIAARNSRADGSTSSRYEDKDNTPTASLIFKPLPWLTTYASYMEALEQGGVAAETYGGAPVTNAFEVMPPLVSEQIEIGAKMDLDGVLLTLAAFEIDKGLQYYDLSDATQPTFVQDGRQVHRGLEFTATGKPTSAITVVGGLTLLDPSIEENKQNPALEGNRPADVARQLFKFYGEYALANISGLSLNAGVSHVGDAYGNLENTDRLPKYTLADAGVRYAIDLGGQTLTLRANVNNLFDERYWANQYFLGDARNFVVSVNLRF